MKKFFTILILAFSATTTFGQIYGTNKQGRKVLIKDPLEWEGFQIRSSGGRLATGFPKVTTRQRTKGVMYVFVSPVPEDAERGIIDCPRVRNNPSISGFIVRQGALKPEPITATIISGPTVSVQWQGIFNDNINALSVPSGDQVTYYFNTPKMFTCYEIDVAEEGSTAPQLEYEVEIH
jgi:hypothetical protein